MKRGNLFIGVVIVLLTFLGVGLVAAEEPVEGRPGRAEMRFLEGMIDHHQMALDMANNCLMKAASEPVKTLCQGIIDAQAAEITIMQGWLLAWYNIQYAPVPMMAQSNDDMAGMDHSAMPMDPNAPATDPAMMMGMMAGLSRLEGQAYEIAFLESMIDHHDDAIHMSERILKNVPEGTGHTELREMAQTIISDQTAEIDKMEGMITNPS